MNVNGGLPFHSKRGGQLAFSWEASRHRRRRGASLRKIIPVEGGFSLFLSLSFSSIPVRLLSLLRRAIRNEFPTRFNASVLQMWKYITAGSESRFARRFTSRAALDRSPRKKNCEWGRGVHKAKNHEHTENLNLTVN